MMMVAPVLGDEYSGTENFSGQPQTQYSISLGVGGQVKPSYPGAGEYMLSPFPIIDIHRFYLPGLGQVKDGSGRANGLSIYPSFSFVGEREPRDSAILTGTRPVDWAGEAGLGIRYKQDFFEGFVEFRQGFNGHTGQVGTVGFDLISEPFERTKFKIGPRANWGSGEYMETYFGVTAAEAAAPGSRLAAFAPGAGFNSVGVEASATYDLTERTTLHFRAGWERYIGDAEDSPIVVLGDENQFTAGIGISRRFDFNLFD